MPASRPPIRRTEFAAPVVLVAALAVTIALLVRFSIPFDLRVYLAGGSAVVHGDNLYAPGLVADGAGHGYGFTYPPFAGAVFAPLSITAAWFATAVLTALSLVSLALLVETSRPGLLRRSVRELVPAVVVAGCLLSEPVRVTLWNGQINLVLVALLALDHLRAPGSAGRGIATGLAAAVKLTPALFVVLLLVERDRRAAVRAVVTFAACAGFGALVDPGASRHFWFGGIADRANLGDMRRFGNQSLYALWSRATSEGAARVLWVLSSLVVFGLLLLVTRRAVARGERLLAWAVTGVAACLISPVSWTHHWIWWIPLVAALLPYAARSRAVTGAVAALVVVFVVGCNKPPFEQTFGNAVGRAVVGNLYVLAGVAVLVALAVADLRRRRVVS